MADNLMTIRDANGQMVMKIDQTMGGRMVRELVGKWRPRTTKSGKEDTVFEVTQDAGWGIEHPGLTFKIFLWKGYVVCQE